MVRGPMRTQSLLQPTCDVLLKRRWPGRRSTQSRTRSRECAGEFSRGRDAENSRRMQICAYASSLSECELRGDLRVRAQERDVRVERAVIRRLAERPE